MSERNVADDASEIPRGFRSVVRNVLRYLVANPDGKDTVEGITRWWQPAGGVGGSANDVEGALEFFAKRSWVSGRGVGPGVRLWSANPERLAEMRKFLDEMDRGSEAGKD